MIINQQGFYVQTNNDTVQIVQGARWNGPRNELEPIHADRDILMIELVNTASEEGYISFKRAQAGGGKPVFVEFMRLDANGSLILTSSFIELSEISAPASPAADKLRLYAVDDTGTTKLAYKDSAGAQTVL